MSSLSELFAQFEEVWAVDTEFIARPGERYDPICLVARELKSGRLLRLWHNRLGPNPPYRTDAGVLFFFFVANAELGFHLSKNWPMPVNVVDLSAEFRCFVNGRKTPAGKGLLGALTYFGHDTISTQRKEAMRKRIMQGPPFTAEEIAESLDYCTGDVDDLAKLLLKLLPIIDLKIALYRGKFVSVLAAMEHRGVPIDMEIFARLVDKKTWRALRDAMVPVIDADFGVYVRDKGGGWSFSKKLFAAYCERRSPGPGLNPASSTYGAKRSRLWPRPGRSSSRCVSCVTHATSCEGSNSRLVLMAAIELCCGHLRQKPVALSRKHPSGFSRQRFGCDR